MHVSFQLDHAVIQQSTLPKSPYPYYNMQLPKLPTILEDSEGKESAQNSPDDDFFEDFIQDYYNPSSNSSGC
jgi:hypothetical protein